MAFVDQSTDGLLLRRNKRRVFCDDANGAHVIYIHHTPHGRCYWQDDAIVKIHAHWAGAALLEKPLHGKADLVDVEALSYRISISKEFSFHRLADDADPSHR